MALTLKLRRDTAATWTSVNPVLNDGELAYEHDTGRAKLGDGSTAWRSLAYWNTNGPATLGPVTRRPAWRQASYSQIFATGHGWVTNGTGIGSSNLNDTSVFIKGTQSVTITTAANGAQAAVRSTSVPTQDLTGKALRITLKIDDVTHLNQLSVFVGSSSFTNNFNWTFHTHSASAQNIIQSGEWVTLTTSWSDVQTAAGSYTISSTGVPSTTSGFTALQVAAFDDGVGAVTMHLQSIEVIPATATTFPTGVVSVVFDDSFQNVYDNARPIMDALGYRGTLYTITDVIGVAGSLTLTELKNLQTISGWEIGGHAYTSAAHNAGYDTLTASQVADEMRLMRAWMVSNGFPVDSFAYPHGTFANTTDSVAIDQICSQYFSTGRSVISETAETFPPAMPYRMRAKTGISSSGGGGTLVSTITATGGALDRCQLDGSWYIINLHQVVNSGVSTSTQILTSDFSTLMSAISARGIPVLPVGDVMRNYS